MLHVFEQPQLPVGALGKQLGLEGPLQLLDGHLCPRPSVPGWAETQGILSACCTPDFYNTKKKVLYINLQLYNNFNRFLTVSITFFFIFIYCFTWTLLWNSTQRKTDLNIKKIDEFRLHMGNCVTLIIECAVNIPWTFSVIGGVYFSPTMSTEGFGWGGWFFVDPRKRNTMNSVDLQSSDQPTQAGRNYININY